MLIYIPKCIELNSGSRHKKHVFSGKTSELNTESLFEWSFLLTHTHSCLVIKCWVPAFFTANYEQYANEVCWVSNTYYVNTSDAMPKDDNTKKDSEIKYYQFIPVSFVFFFAFWALCIWKYNNWIFLKLYKSLFFSYNHCFYTFHAYCGVYWLLARA